MSKKGSEIEFTKKVEEKGSKWLPGIVTDVDDAFDTVSVKFMQSGGEVRQEIDIDIDSEKVSHAC